MNARNSSTVLFASVVFVGVVLVGGYFLVSNQSETTEAAPVVSTSTSTTAPIAVTLPPTPVTTWELPPFDGSVRLSGSVGTDIRTSDATWEPTDDGWWYLAIDGAPAFDLGDATCLDAACDIELNQLADGGRFVWVTESALGFSDELNHAIAPSGEALAACWSQEYEGPVVAIDDFDAAAIVRAWVLTEHEGTTTWLGLDPSTIDRNDVLPLPFAGYDFPTC